MSVKLKRGDKLYRYVVGPFEYTVIGIRENREGISYELLCEPCSHGWKCEILVGPDDKGNLKYICMLNNHDDDDQSHFHNVEGQYFHRTVDAACKNRCDDIVRFNRDNIKRLKSEIERSEEKIKLALTFGGTFDDFKRDFCI